MKCQSDAQGPGVCAEEEPSPSPRQNPEPRLLMPRAFQCLGMPQLAFSAPDSSSPLGSSDYCVAVVGMLRILVRSMPQSVGTGSAKPREPLLALVSSFCSGVSAPRAPREATPSKFSAEGSGNGCAVLSNISVSTP